MGIAGVTFYFGGKKPAPAPAPAPKVEAPPAPAPKAEAKVEPAPAPAPEPDSDGDGVPDSMDKCPDTPKGVAVDKDGCPLDSDGDGVADYLDKCPGTPKGVAVDKDGCPLPIKTEQTYEIKVEFDFDKDFVRPRYHDELKNIAGIIKQYPENKAVIEGYTDSKGSDSYNLKLSQRRADSVRKYLIDNFGVNPNQLSAKGYGETRPIATNDTDEGRQRNRRVELHLTTIKMQKP
jgi:OOP family OmpA-OmpF porin